MDSSENFTQYTHILGLITVKKSSLNSLYFLRYLSFSDQIYDLRGVTQSAM